MTQKSKTPIKKVNKNVSSKTKAERKLALKNPSLIIDNWKLKIGDKFRKIRNTLNSPKKNKSIKSKSKSPSNIDFIILFSGIILIGTSLFFKYYSSNKYSFKGNVPSLQIEERSVPQKIEIISLGINLPIVEGKIESGNWLVSENSATHLDRSKVPGEGGNIVIYGHNKWDIFGKLKQIKLGEEIKITNEKGREFYYSVSEVNEVTPDAIDFVLPKNEEILTIYTCSGFADRKRFIVIAKPVKG